MEAPETFFDMWPALFEGGYVWLIIKIWFISMVVGYAVGWVREQLHLRSLRKREGANRDIFLSNHKTLPDHASDSQLVTTNLVLAADSFRVISLIYRRLFGGRIRRYEIINSRAKREALVRLQDMARSLGANAIYNIRIQTSTIKSNQRQNHATNVEVLAYGTAVRLGN